MILTPKMELTILGVGLGLSHYSFFIPVPSHSGQDVVETILGAILRWI